MSVLDLHADELARTAENTRYIPQLKPPGSKFNAWRTTTAIPRGAAAGGAEAAGFWSDVMGAFGQAYATTEPAAPMFGNDPRAKETEEARRKMLDTGLDFSSETGDIFRNVGRDYRPDHQSAHLSESLLYDLSRFATKAVGYSVLGGPWLGAGFTAADEALAASDELKRQGVDLSTRTKVGAIQGGGAGISVLLPVAGKTWAQTAGLVALGGPGTFMAQQAITRQVLKDADYTKLADQYDPFDPVGLTVSTLVPAAFGVAARRARVPREVPTQRVVDAAMVAHQREAREASALAPKEDIQAAARHQEALAKAEDQMARGEPVRVVVPDVERAANFRAWFGDSKVVDSEGRPLVLYHGTAADVEAFSPTVSSDGAIHLTTSPESASVYAASRAMDEGRGANVVPVFVQADRIKDVPIITTDAIETAKAEGFDAVRRANDPINKAGGSHVVVFRPEQVKSAIGNSGRFDPTSSSLADPITTLAKEVRAAITAAQREAKAMSPAPEAPPKAVPTESRAAKKPTPPASGDVAAPKVDELNPDAPVPAPPEEVASQTTRLTEIEQEFPDLMVQMDGMENPQRLSDFLASVKREADAMRQDAPDFEVAANCLLTNGL